ncbi:hypothetical protein, partial [Burkholderia ubonensis]
PVFAASRASRAAVLVATHVRSVCKQTLAITVDGRPHFYRPDGVLLAALEFDMKPWIWTPIVKNNQLLAFDREGMDARVIWVALSDYSFIETGQTHADCVNMLREGLSGWLPK